jgi:hypothetical protein
MAVVPPPLASSARGRARHSPVAARPPLLAWPAEGPSGHLCISRGLAPADLTGPGARKALPCRALAWTKQSLHAPGRSSPGPTLAIAVVPPPSRAAQGSGPSRQGRCRSPRRNRLPGVPPPLSSPARGRTRQSFVEVAPPLLPSSTEGHRPSIIVSTLALLSSPVNGRARHVLRRACRRGHGTAVASPSTSNRHSRACRAGENDHRILAARKQQGRHRAQSTAAAQRRRPIRRKGAPGPSEPANPTSKAETDPSTHTRATQGGGVHEPKQRTVIIDYATRLARQMPSSRTRL